MDCLNNLSEIKVCKSYNSKKYEDVNFSESDILESLSLENTDFESVNVTHYLIYLYSFLILIKSFAKSLYCKFIKVTSGIISKGDQSNIGA
mgnify:CR=1 FL=1